MQTEGANDRVQLAELGRELNRRILTRWMRDGVTVMDPATTWVDADVVLAPDVTILPGTQLLGATVVGRGRRDRPRHHPQGLRDRRRRPRGPHPRRAGGDRRRGQRRPVLLPPARHPARRPGQDRRLRRDQERRDRRRREGAAPLVRRRRRDRRGHQHRRRARSSPTTTGSRSTAPPSAGTPGPGPTTRSSPPSTSATAPAPAGAPSSAATYRRVRWRCPAGRSATSSSWAQRKRPGTAQADAAEAATRRNGPVNATRLTRNRRGVGQSGSGSGES